MPSIDADWFVGAGSFCAFVCANGTLKLAIKRPTVTYGLCIILLMQKERKTGRKSTFGGAKECIFRWADGRLQEDSLRGKKMIVSD
ncbi:hypothetical protein GCM10027578_18590 [Spirosoma luteolum]